MKISDALKYSQENMVDDNLTINIDGEQHTILLDILNHCTFKYDNNSENSDNITVSKNIKLFNLQIFLICIL